MEMAFSTKLVDGILVAFFAVIAVATPAIDAQTCLPARFFPRALVEVKGWYAREYGDYLVAEKPGFFVGVVWLELLFQWPLSLLSLYGLLFANSEAWLNTTCLMYGASLLTSMVAILSEMIGSGRASDKLLSMYFPFLGLALVAMIRGLLRRSHTEPRASPTKKRA